MTTDLQVSTGQETQNPEPDAVLLDAPKVEAETSADAPPAAEKPADDAAKAFERTQRRIDKLVAKNHRTAQENEQLRTELARVDSQQDQTTQRQLTQADVDAQTEFNVRVLDITRQTNDAVKAGIKANPDFLAVVQNGLMKDIPLFRANGLPTDFMEVVLEADAPESVLYYLSKNPDIADELADLSKTKLAKRLDRIEIELASKAKTKPGSAPTPLTPVNGISNTRAKGTTFDQLVENARAAYMKMS